MNELSRPSVYHISDIHMNVQTKGSLGTEIEEDV